MVPSLFHAPPVSRGASQSSSVVPLARSTRFSLPREPNASERLSGDQNGQSGSSVPGKGLASADSSAHPKQGAAVAVASREGNGTAVGGDDELVHADIVKGSVGGRRERKSNRTGFLCRPADVHQGAG